MRKYIRLPSKNGRAVWLTNILANTYKIWEKWISEPIIKWYRTTLVNLIDYVRQKLGESYLRANRAPLVNQTDYVRVWEKVISEPILLRSSIEHITSNDEKN